MFLNQVIEQENERMTEADWEKLNELLTQVINLKLSTWQQKLEEFKSNIDEDVWNEIESWFVCE